MSGCLLLMTVYYFFKANLYYFFNAYFNGVSMTQTYLFKEHSYICQVLKSAKNLAIIYLWMILIHKTAKSENFNFSS